MNPEPTGPFSFARFRRNYLKVVRMVLARRWLVLGGYLVAAALVLGLCGLQVGQEISPQVDSGQFQMRLKAPVGSRLEVTEELTRQALEEMKNILGDGQPANLRGPHRPDGADLDSQRGVSVDQRAGSGRHPHRPERGEEVPHRGGQGTAAQGTARSVAALAGQHAVLYYGVAENVADKRAEQVAVSFEPADVINQVMSFGSPTPVEVVISGPNQEDNRMYAEKVSAEMRKIPSLRDLQFGQAFDYPRIKVEIDRERAGQAGLTVAEAANAMIAATSSSRYIVPVYWADPKTGIGYQVQLQVPPAQMNSNAEVGMIPVKQNEDRAATLLRDVAKVTDSTMPQEYDRINQRRIVSITANVVGEDLGRAVRRIEEAITAAGDPPRGVKVGDDHGHIRGQVPAMRQMFSGLASGLGYGRGGRVPDAHRLFPVDPAGLGVGGDDAGGGGGCGVRPVHHQHDSEHSVVHGCHHGDRRGGGQRHSAGHLRREGPAGRGMGAAEGARTGAEERLRPILMTSCAMIAGMVPMALGLGEGGEQSAPLGRAVIGGLFVATGATLLILPAVFAVVMGRASTKSPSLDPGDPESRYYLSNLGSRDDLEVSR